MWANFWMLRVNDRLTRWKEFRQSIDKLSLEQAVGEVNSMWSTAPFVTYYLPPDRPAEWPDPWELLAENYYCDIAKALGAMYTIYFTGHKNTDMSVEIYYDYNTKVRSNVLNVADGKYILNYYPFEIVNTKQIEEQKLELLYRYSSKDLHLEKY